MTYSVKKFNLINMTRGILLVFAICGIATSHAAVSQRAASETTTAAKQATIRPSVSRMPTMSTRPNLSVGTVTAGSNNNNSAGNNGNDGNNNGGNNNNNNGNNNNGGTTNTGSDFSNEIIEDKTDQFDAIVSSSAAGTIDATTTNLAELIRQQRAALDAASAEEFGNKNSNGTASGLSACDSGLRACMQQKCGPDYLKCAGDGDTAWGMKMDACRSDTKCSAHEYLAFAAEIKADRDMNLRLESYQKIIDCGNTYNACIENECTASFSKCLGKRAGDAAIAKCESIAKSCVEQDSGLASRTMNVFATLRQDAEKQIKADEKRLYELRDKMANTCSHLGAMFDQRSLDCVFTVNFWAGESPSVPYASKKLYAGSTFDCDQNWFGVNITTFKENAYRLTREQTSASSAMLGAGLGTAVGAVTSGAIDRAIDRHKADKAVKKAQKEDEKYGTYDDNTDDVSSDTDKTNEQGGSDTDEDPGDTNNNTDADYEKLQCECFKMGCEGAKQNTPECAAKNCPHTVNHDLPCVQQVENPCYEKADGTACKVRAGAANEADGTCQNQTCIEKTANNTGGGDDADNDDDTGDDDEE